MNTVVVVDLEATCWFPRNANGGQKAEIIEIGIAKLHLEGRGYEVEKVESIYVQPRYSTVSEFCTELTGITQAQLDREGVPFEQALERLRDHCLGPNYLHRGGPLLYSWASYGEWDRDILERQCQSFGVRYPMSRTHFNIKALLNLLRGDKHVGLSKAVKSFGMEFEGKHHSGVDDAVNAARVLGEMVKRYRMKEIK